MARKLFSLHDLEKIVETFYRENYEVFRGGYYDFPSEEDFVADEVKRFRLNHPELFGFVWDERNEDWVFLDSLTGHTGSLHRMVDRTGKKKKHGK